MKILCLYFYRDTVFCLIMYMSARYILLNSLELFMEGKYNLFDSLVAVKPALRLSNLFNIIYLKPLIYLQPTCAGSSPIICCIYYCDGI